ncbi:MAG TPA: glutathione S-transferase family protein, partial [Burkholderiaceae bacterium]
MLKIYGVPISVHTRKVIVAAKLKGLPFELIPVVPVIPGNPPPHWRQLSPTGKIPVLQDGDFTLADSAAICAYLERLHPQPSLYPSDARAYARALWLEQYGGGTIFNEIVHPLFHETFVHPKVKNIPTDPARVNAVLDATVPQVFGYLESVAGDAFLAG